MNDFWEFIKRHSDLIGLVIALLGGLFMLYVDILRIRFRQREQPNVESYGQRLASLTESLSRSSSEVDSILKELGKVASEREKAVRELETQLSTLEANEKQIQKRIEELQQVPVPVAEHFAALIAQGEKRSAWRDYILFGSGVIVSTIIAVVLKLIGLG